MILLFFILTLGNVFASDYTMHIQKVSIVFHKDAIKEFRNVISRVTYNITSDSLDQRLSCGPFLQISPNETFSQNYDTEEYIPFTNKLSIKIKLLGQQFRSAQEAYFHLSEKKLPYPGQHIIVFKLVKDKFISPYIQENVKEFTGLPESKHNLYYTMKISITENQNKTESNFRGKWCKIEEIRPKQNKYISLLTSWVQTLHFKVSACIIGVFILLIGVIVCIYQRKEKSKDKGE